MCFNHYINKINQAHRASSLFAEKPTIDFDPRSEGAQGDLRRLKQAMALRGGYILHLDGTCEADSPQLFTGIDGIAHIVLDNIKLPSEKAELLIPFIRRIKRQYGDPIALVHDMGHGLMSAIGVVFPGVRDFICHFH